MRVAVMKEDGGLNDVAQNSVSKPQRTVDRLTELLQPVARRDRARALADRCVSRPLPGHQRSDSKLRIN